MFSKAWWAKRKETQHKVRLVKLQAQIDELMKDPQSDCAKLVRGIAREIAGRMIMNHFDSKGIRHCAFCPSTDQLRKILDGFCCPPHYEMVAANEAEEAKKKAGAENNGHKGLADLGLVKP